MTDIPLTEGLPHAGGAPPCRARLRLRPEDFQVDEVLGFEPSGEGDHALVQVRKTGFNSQEVARRLARLAGVAVRDVGLAGLKDRNAVTTQWFSVPVKGPSDPSWQALEGPGIEVLRVGRQRKKLRRGVHRGNRFAIVLREIAGPWQGLCERVEWVAARGVPNYFGEQRFGQGGANLEAARRMLAGEIRVRDRQRRGLFLSAVRSWLFNGVLARRVEAGLWDRAVSGDVMGLDGRRGLFAVETVDEETASRTRRGEIHPTGPLWGRGGIAVTGAAARYEEEALRDRRWWCEALEAAGLELDRRPFRLGVEDLTLEPDGEARAVLRFTLGRGGYATTVLRELVRTA